MSERKRISRWGTSQTYVLLLWRGMDANTESGDVMQKQVVSTKHHQILSVTSPTKLATTVCWPARFTAGKNAILKVGFFHRSVCQQMWLWVSLSTNRLFSPTTRNFYEDITCRYPTRGGRGGRWPTRGGMSGGRLEGRWAAWGDGNGNSAHLGSEATIRLPSERAKLLRTGLRVG